jgi:hypothetical protein
MAADRSGVMTGNENSAGTADALKNSITVWDGNRTGGSFSRLQRTALTFFYSVRSATFFRFYFWGNLYGITPFPSNIRATAVSDDAREQAIPVSSPSNTPGALSAYTAPNTEEFLDFDAPLFPIPNLVDIFSAVGGQAPLIIACDADGKLYACGDAASPHGSDYPSNPLGLGARQFGPVNSQSYSPASQPTLQRVYGDSDFFSLVKFSRVCFTRALSGVRAGRTAGVALSDDGRLWMSGNVEDLANSSDFPENSTSLAYFRNREITQWYDSTGTLTSGSPLRFTHVCPGAFETQAGTPIGTESRCLYLLDEDGRLFVVGGFLLGKAITSATPHEVGGFVDSVDVLTSGKLYSLNTKVVFSPPDSADGTTATGYAELLPFANNIDNYPIVKIHIVNPGWGYSSPPTITLTDIGSGTGATFSCNLFSDTWKHVYASRDGRIVAVSSAGVIYNWGEQCVSPSGFEGFPSPDFPELIPTRCRAPRRANATGEPQPAVYERAYCGSFAAIAIDEDGRASFRALEVDVNGAASPDMIEHKKWTLLEDVSEVGSYTFVDAAITRDGGVVALLRDDGSVYTYGRATHALAHGKDSFLAPDDPDFDETDGPLKARRLPQKIIGSALWQGIRAVWGSSNAFLGIRQPFELDEYGRLKEPLPPYEDSLP